MADCFPDGGVIRNSFRTTETTVAEEALSTGYAPTSLLPVASGRDFELGHETLVAPGFALSQLWLTCVLDAVLEPMADKYVVDLVRGGRMDRESTAFGSVQYGEGEAAAVPVDGRYRALAEDIDLDIVTLDIRRVNQFAELTYGTPADRIRLTGALPVSAARARRWEDTVLDVRDRVLGNPMLLDDNPLALDIAFRRLSIEFLRTFPNTVLSDMTGRDAASAPVLPARTTRAVTDFLHAHAGEPVGPAELVGLTERPAWEAVAGLKRAGVDPAVVLWRSRLEGVRRDLRQNPPDPQVVRRVAARWGFVRYEVFRVAYSRHFGETPERTAAR